MRTRVLLFLAGTGMWAQSPTNTCTGELCAAIGKQRVYKEEIALFYQASNFKLAWVRDGGISPRAFALLDRIKRADAHGLRPVDYSLDLSPSRSEFADFDVALTKVALRYASDLHFGRADPGTYRTSHDFRSEPSRLPGLVRAHLLDEPDLDVGLRRLEPPFDGYQRTLAALARYRTLATMDDGAELPTTANPVESGQPYAGISRLVRLLTLLGDLPDGSEPPSVYTGTLVDAVRRFQERHGLEPDGRIGKATLRQLNTPLRFRIAQLELTLERWRWVPHAFSRPPLVVNLPEFLVRSYNASFRPEFQMKIVAGAAYRYRTPTLSGLLQYVIFRPYWNVPLSIQREELIPLIRQDSSYIAKHGYEVIARDGKVAAKQVVPDEMLPQLESGELSLRQIPGPNNALGLVKFVFPNRQDVYLHDTPARELFRKVRRDFSHGCMRVEHPADLAEWVLREESGWSRERIEAAMNGTETVRVNLKRPIPVLIVYGTAVALDDGEVHFLPDLYEYDAALAKDLARRK